ncbi:hypothetical protein CK203_101797 [Vitis vinifera]|uniref:Retrotransposon gag domain-containing protein n=1 Tax=Vitis vinifera TaxID=29760 RepID=A0A438FFU1_VITVI|nr:hypothetical protein CK203_101797 [Vitis vinifera]
MGCANFEGVVRKFRTSLEQLASEGHIFLISALNRTRRGPLLELRKASLQVELVAQDRVLLNLTENESLLVLLKLEVVHPLHNGRLSSGQSLERSEQGTALRELKWMEQEGLPLAREVLGNALLTMAVSCNLCMPYWIRDQEGRLVRIENPQDTELDICVNIMDPPQEDQNSQQVKGLIIRPHIVPLLPNFHGMESENPYAHIKEFEEDQWVEETNLKLFCKENEKFHECWERYMEAINACPHHGFDTWLLNPEEAMDFLSYVSEVSRGWDEPNSREKGKFPSQQPKIQRLEYECPTMPAVREMLGDQANVVGQFRPNNSAPYGNTYNSSWRNHPNFSWKPRPPPYQPQAQTQAPQQTSSVEQAIVNLSKVMGDFVGEQKAINSQLHQKIEMLRVLKLREWMGMQNDLSQKIDNIQYSISRLTNLTQ